MGAKEAPMLRFMMALLFVLASGCTCYDKKTDLSYDKTNVPYGVFDWYRPTTILGTPIESGPKGLPCVVYVHGGAWMGGDKADGHYIADKICCHGYTVISVNYHLTADLTMPGGQVVKGAPWPAQFNDLKTFLIYLKANAATFGIDPDRIASVGISAGGHLAQMLHLRDSRVHTLTACDLDGETDLTQPGGQVMTDYDNIMTKAGGIAPVTTDGWSDPAKRTPAMTAICQDMSTVPLVTKDSKVFILHGERDTNIFVKQGDTLAAKCQAVGCEYDYVRLPASRGECHGKCLDDEEAFEHFLAWLDKHLK